MTRKTIDETAAPAAASPANEPAHGLSSEAQEQSDPAAVSVPAEAPPISANKASVARAAKAREDRLAQALRTNLARRKAAARAMREGE